MKNIFFLIILFLTLFSVNLKLSADEIYLYKDDIFTVKSDSFFIDDNKNINILRGSNLDIRFISLKNEIDNSYDEYESVDIDFYNKLGEKKKTISSKDAESVDSYFSKYGKIENDIYIFNFPIELEKGEYKMNIKLKISDKKILNMSKDIYVSENNFYFNNPKFFIDDKDINFQLDYKSVTTVSNDNNYKVLVKITDNENNVIFDKNYKYTFTDIGLLNINDTLDKNLKKDLKVDVRIFDINDEMQYLYNTDIKYEKSQSVFKNLFSNYILYLISLSLFIIIMFIFKKIKNKEILKLFILFCIFFIKIDNVIAIDESICQNKPADYCSYVENGTSTIYTHSCVTSNNCASSIGNDNRKKFFYLGNPGYISSPSARVGPVSAKINVCSSIKDLDKGDDFYVISDVRGSDWIDKSYHIFEFTRGKKVTFVNQPYSKKTNINTAYYDGDCNVNIVNQYSGKSSKFKNVHVAIIESGRIYKDITCKANSVNSNLFKTNGVLLDVKVCKDPNQVYDTFIKGSVEVAKSSVTRWVGPVSVGVDICKYLDPLNKGVDKKDFYVVVDQEGSAWAPTRYRVAQFKKGEKKSFSIVEGGKKRNHNTISYDGNCGLTSSSQYSGKSSNFKKAKTTIFEIGYVDDAVCKNKFDGGYFNYSSFYDKLNMCDVEISNKCVLQSDWVVTKTDNSCGITEIEDDNTGCSCQGRDKVCVQDNATTTEYGSDSCLLKTECQISQDKDNIKAILRTYNNIGDITYNINGLELVDKDKNDTTHIFTVSTSSLNLDSDKIDLNINYSVLDKDDNTSFNNVCSVSLDKTILPDEIGDNMSITLIKTPKIVADRNNKCKFDWDIKFAQGYQCDFYEGGIIKQSKIGSTGTFTTDKLNKNTKYNIICKDIKDSNKEVYEKEDICRINPAVMEN